MSDKQKIDQIAEKVNKEINSLDKAQKEGIQLKCITFKWEIEKMADKIGVSRDALLMAFADLMLQAAIETAEGNALDKLSQIAKEQENAELQALAEKLVKTSIEFEQSKKAKRKKAMRIPPKNGYIQ